MSRITFEPNVIHSDPAPDRPRRPTRWLRGLGVGLGAWLVIATGLWTLRGPTTGNAIATAVAAALLMAWVVSWIARRFGTTSRHWLALVGAHAFMALLFGSLMVVLTYAVQAAADDVALRTAMGEARFLGAEFVFWAWLYVVFAWGAHGLQTREEFRAERERIALSEASLAEARLAALRGQLNPHFLFNALHTVSSLLTEDPERASEALALLGDLLRYTIDDAEARIVPMEEELAFTRRYLDLAQIVMGDRLRVGWHVDSETRSLTVPPLVLQVLVENAIRHGVQPRPEGGEVTVHVAHVQDTVRLSVENDHTAPAPDAGAAPVGSGLDNLRKRLATLYGTRAHLDSGPHRSGRYVATVDIPL